MNRTLVAAIAALALAAVTNVAIAAPSLSFRVFEDGVAQGLPVTSVTGVSSTTIVTPSFSIVSGFAIGIPLIAAPSMTAQTTSISSNTNFGAGGGGAWFPFRGRNYPTRLLPRTISYRV